MQTLSYEAFAGRIDPESLCSGSIFGAIPAEVTEFLLKNGRLIALDAGDTLYRYGESGEKFSVVCEGHIDFYKKHDGQISLTRQVGFGEEVGFVSMIALHERTGDAVAGEAAVVLEISTELFASLHEYYPAEFGILLLNLARDLARSVRKLSNSVVELGTLN